MKKSMQKASKSLKNPVDVDTSIHEMTETMFSQKKSKGMPIVNHMPGQGRD